MAVFVAITPARAGVLRSDAGRSGWPVQLGVQVPLYCLSNVARSGATRSNYHSGEHFISIDGVFYPVGDHRLGARAPGILVDDFEIEDAVDETPSTLACIAIGFVPKLGAPIIVTLGSKNNNDREFAGTILTREYGYHTTPKNATHRLTAIDWTWGLTSKKVTERYQSASIATILADLLGRYAPGYTHAALMPDPGNTVLDEITFTNEDLPDALTRALKRAGGNWYCDYLKDIHGFVGLDPTIPPPGVLNAVNPALLHFSFSRDLSQYLSRVYVEGGGSSAWACPPGETQLPLQDASWYPNAGTVVSGPQRITYTGVIPGRQGALVGPGARPSQRPILLRTAGAGLAAGLYWYSFTYVTPSGESLSGPAQWIQLGPVAPPTTAPTPGTPKPGPGPDAGIHTYTVTFLTSTGETTAGPTVDAATGVTPPPTAAPDPSGATVGAGLPDGAHAYACTFVTPTGETTPGPIGDSVTTGPRPTPTTAPTVGTPTNGPGPDPGAHRYALSYVYADGGETIPSPLSAAVTTNDLERAPTTAPTPAQSTSGLGTTLYKPGDLLRWDHAWLNAQGQQSPGSLQSPAVTAVQLPGAAVGTCYTYNVTLPPGMPTDPRVTQKRSYLYVNNSPKAYRTDSLGTTYLPDWNGPAYTGMPPLAQYRTTPLSNLQTGPTGASGVTSRNLYRTAAGGTQLKLLVNIANTGSTYTDVTPDSALGVFAPTSSSANLNQVPLVRIPKGDATVTGRRLYRRDDAISPDLKLLTTILDNTTVTYLDILPAGFLGGPPPTANTASLNQIPLADLPLGEAGLVIGRAVYRSPAVSPGGTPLLAFTVNDNVTKTAIDTVPDSSLGAPIPSSNTALAQQVDVTGIAIGGDPTSSRKIYRSAVNDTALKHLVTIPNNTGTTYHDAAPDSALGGPTPVSDLSGLTQPDGVVAAGATSLVVASTAAFDPAGGWIVIGNGQQVVRYAGLSGNTLTGIPPFGPGAISAAVAYSSTATVPPTLTGIPTAGPGRIKWPIPTGDPVNLWIQVDDPVAQAELAALLGTDGIVEDVLQDNRLSYTEAVARGRAHLAERNTVLVTVRYRTRDYNTSTGAAVVINLGDPINLLSQPFLIQHVVHTVLANHQPVFDVEASSTLYRFETWLKLLRRKD